MISFSKLGKYGRFGNQLFQYAFLRTQANRLHTHFYCPSWIGEIVFSLNDQNERGELFTPNYFYTEGDYKHGFHPDVLDIKDGTEIGGYFQSDKYFLKNDVKKWFLFREEIFSDVNKKYSTIDFSESVAMHIRLGDYTHPTLQFYVPKKLYFVEALNLLEHKENILVFSDDLNLARQYLKDVPGNFVFIEGNKDYEDFYLMTKCRNIICSGSSFSWWAAYLNKNTDKKVIVPDAWFLPGSRMTNPDIFVDGWIKVPSTRWYDHYYLKYIPIKIIQLYQRHFSK